MFNAANKRREAVEQRRALHARIARSRRRLNGHTIRLIQGGFWPNSWRQRIQDHPVMALATAAGAGMLLAQIWSRSSAVGRWGELLAQWLAGGTWTTMMKRVERFFSHDDATSSPPDTTQPAEQRGPEHA